MQYPTQYLVDFLPAKRWPAVFGLILIGSSALYGQDVWQGATSSWFIPGNWSLGAPPTTTQTALVDNGTTAQIEASGAVANTLTIGTPPIVPSPGLPTITIAGSAVQMLSGGVLTVTNPVVIETDGTLRFSGGQVFAPSFQNNGNMVFDGPLDHALNSNVTGSGNFIMAGTGTLAVNARMGDSPNVLVNSGVLRINFNGAITNGTISVNGGTAQIAAAGEAVNTVTIGTTTAGSTLQMLPGGALTVTNPVLIGTGGTLRFSGGGNSGGTLTAVGIQNNGNIVFDGPLDHVMAIPVTGSGNYIMAGTGTLAVNARMGDSPNVLVNSGVLRINFNGAITNGTISVNGGTAQIAAAGEVVNTLTIGTTVAGSTLQMLPGGDLTVNSPVIIGTGGTLRFSGGGNSGGTLFANAIQDNGNIVFDGSLDHALNAVVTGSGNLVMAGTGTLSINGNSTYSGGTTISDGTVRAGSATGFSPNSAFMVNSILDLNGFNSTIGSLSGTGTILNNGEVAATLTVGNDNTNSIFSGVLKDGTSVLQLTKSGTGVLTLRGANTYTGTTTVNDGSLIVDRSIASAQTLVNASGLLGGGGLLGGDLVNSGIVSPGDSPGTLTISGNYTQNANGTLRIEVEGTAKGQFDVLALGRHASLNGTLQLISVGGFKLQVGDQVTFLTAKGGVSGTFSTIQNPFISNTIVKAQIVYSPDDVQFVGTQGSFAAFATDPNCAAVAHALDSAVGDPRASKLINFLNNEPLNKLCPDFDLIAPEAVASVYNIAVSTANVQSANLGRRMDDIRAGSTGFSAAGFTMNGITPSFSSGLGGPTGPEGKTGPSVITPVPENRWGVFATGLGEFTHVDSTDVARGYDLQTGGVTLGVDYRVCPFFAVGLLAGYAHTNADLANNGNLDVNSGNFGIYATAFSGGFYLDTAVTGGPSEYDSHRTALLGTASGSTDGGDLNVLVNGGYDWRKGGLSIGPMASFQYTYVSIDGFTESGSLAPLKFNDQHVDSIRTAFGGKASYDWKVGHVLVRPELRAAWQHEYGNSAYSIVASFANGAGTSFTVSSPRIGRDSLLLGAGVAVLWNDRISTYIYYDGELGRTNYDSHNVSAGVRVTF